jgi:hypothetical protein
VNELVEAVERDRVILFVGSGVSQNLSLPSWSELVDQIAQQLGFDPDVFRLLGDERMLAEYYNLEKGTLGPLRSFLDQHWHDPKTDIGKSEIHRYIVSLRFPIIYTTNYDAWIERAFKHFGEPYVKISSVADLLKIKDGITQIVKFHGDFEADETIVLTESSYFERLNFNAHLDIKFKADLIARSVLFIGHSLSDINIRYLLYQIDQMWKDSPFASVRPRSYVFLSRPNLVAERILKERGIHPIISEGDDPGEGLTRFLRSLAEKTGRT